MGLFSVLGGIIGGKKMKKAADYAGQTINDAAQAGIGGITAEQEQTRTDFGAYRELGAASATRFGDLAGVNGDPAQATALDRIRSSPFFQSLYRTGEEAVLANASATGGLRGGNTQRSLYNLGEDTFATAIDRELAMLSSGMGIGLNATSTGAGLGAQAARDNAGLRLNGAEALAQARLTRAGITAQNWSNAGGFLDSAVSAAIGMPTGGGFSKAAGALF